MADASASETSLSTGSEFVPDTSLSAGSEFVSDTSLSAGSEFVPETSLSLDTEFAQDKSLSTGSELVSDTSLSAGSELFPETSLSLGTEFVQDTSLSTRSELVSDTSLLAGSELVSDTSLSAGSELVSDTSLSAGSELVFDILCQPCRSDGKHAEAEKYCQDCREQLCAQCVVYHKIISYFKDHKLVRSADAYKNIDASFVADIKERSDSWNLYSSPRSIDGITGLALVSVERLVAADHGHRRLLLIDTTKKRVISQFLTEGRPFDVTVCGGEVAAALPSDFKIIFIYVKSDDGLVYVRELRVDGKCCGIDCVDDNLYVVYDWGRKLEVMTVTGTVLQRFQTGYQGEELYRRPGNMTVSTANKSIYVSGLYSFGLLVLGLDGKVKGRYKDTEQGWFGQLAVDTAGVMYLCDNSNSTVHLLSPLCEKVKILLTAQDGLYDPLSVCFCASTERLYIGTGNGSIKIYQISRG